MVGVNIPPTKHTRALAYVIVERHKYKAPGRFGGLTGLFLALAGGSNPAVISLSFSKPNLT